jgi:hypothetical protein
VSDAVIRNGAGDTIRVNDRVVRDSNRQQLSYCEKPAIECLAWQKAQDLRGHGDASKVSGVSKAGRTKTRNIAAT